MAAGPYVAFDAVAVKPLAVSALAKTLLAPPAFTRLEPRSLSGDPSPGLEARIADPLWMLARQWQTGEFRGEDCGRAVSVHVAAEVQALSALRPGGPDKGHAPVPLDPGAVIEPGIEAEPWSPPSLRERAEAAAALVAALVPLGWGGEAAMAAACPFDLADPHLIASRPDPFWQHIARRLPDGEAVALAMEAGTPDWLNGEPQPVQDAAAVWLDWYRRNVSPRGRAGDSWHADRLEYRFGLQAGEGADARRLEAPCHLGGAVDWCTLDLAEGKGLGGDAAAAPVEQRSTRVHASRLRYAGMPDNRLWAMEDGLVNFGVTDVQPHDLARLMLLEYATIFGNDWLVAPLDVPRGALVRVTEVSYRTTFGEEVVLDPAGEALDTRRKGRFRLFHTDGPKGAEPCFVIPPNPRPALEGEPREEVVFARDETANVVWAIEKRVEGADGRGRDRASEVPPLAPPAGPQGGADAAWTLEVLPAAHWVPVVPVPKGGQGFILRKGSFDGTDRAQGHVLSPTPFDLQDEEVPREGVRLRRVPAILRDEDGRLLRWTARRVSTAWGEAASTLAYDVLRGPG